MLNRTGERGDVGRRSPVAGVAQQARGEGGGSGAAAAVVARLRRVERCRHVNHPSSPLRPRTAGEGVRKNQHAPPPRRLGGVPALPGEEGTDL